jgi:hypothetical protein
MEAVLDIYGLPYNIEAPVIVMDEQPVQPPVLRPSNASRKHERRLPRRETMRGVSITNTNGRVLRIFLCSRNRWEDGVALPFVNSKQKRSGHMK